MCCPGDQPGYRQQLRGKLDPTADENLHARLGRWRVVPRFVRWRYQLASPTNSHESVSGLRRERTPPV